MTRLLAGLALAVATVLALAEAAQAEAPSAEGGAITASFSGGILSVTGTPADDVVVISRNASGVLLVNDGAVPVTGGPSTVANTTTVRVRLLDGDDGLTFNQANGALPAADVNGGDGHDDLITGAGPDLVSGGPGNDDVATAGGADVARGGDGNDVVVTGDGNDDVFGDGGADRLRWNPGDDSDEFFGGPGPDRVQFTMGGGAEQITLTDQNGRVQFSRDNPAPFTGLVDAVERLDLAPAGGADVVSVGPMIGTDLRTLAVDLAGSPGLGNDDLQPDGLSVLGGAGPEGFRVAGFTNTLAPSTTDLTLLVTAANPANDTLTVLGNQGADRIDADQLPAAGPRLSIIGGRGNDVLRGGQEGDTFLWNRGDGADRIHGDGQVTAVDHLLVVGDDAGQTFAARPSGSQVDIRTGPSAPAMLLSSIETATLRTRGGTDAVTLGDLEPTALQSVTVDLSGAPGVADGVAEVVTASGTPGPDDVSSSVAGDDFELEGASVDVLVQSVDVGLDRIRVNGLGGADVFDPNSSPLAKLTLSGGGGDDDLRGANGIDLLIGGTGDDTFRWFPGNANDRMVGGGGVDRFEFAGDASAEDLTLARDGTTLRFQRNIGPVDLALPGIERVLVETAGGADSVHVNNLTGTPVTSVVVRMGGQGGPDGIADQVEVLGTTGADTVTLGPSGAGVRVVGLHTSVYVIGTDPTLDVLDVVGLNGGDDIDAGAVPAGRVRLRFFGGAGNDVLTGSPGPDFLDGGTGIDTIAGGAGTDAAINGENVTGVP